MDNLLSSKLMQLLVQWAKALSYSRRKLGNPRGNLPLRVGDRVSSHTVWGYSINNMLHDNNDEAILTAASLFKKFTKLAVNMIWSEYTQNGFSKIIIITRKTKGKLVLNDTKRYLKKDETGYWNITWGKQTYWLS